MAPLRSAALAAALALRLLLAVLLLQRLSDATAAGAAQPLFSLRRHTRPCRTPECCNLRMRQLLEKKEYEHYLNDPGLLALHREMNRFLMKQDSRDGEGNAGDVPVQLAVYQALATELHCVHHVCEIGLNAGHSASTWLYSRPDIQLSSFDNGQHKSAFAVTRFFLDRFPGRVSVRFGDSKISIQHAAALHHGACDLLLIDGGHDYPTAKADLISMHQLANATFNLVVFDDVECPEWYCEEPQQALDEVLKEGVVKQVWKIGLNVSGWGRGFFVGQYQF